MGILQADHASLVSRADLIYRQPVDDGRWGHPVGNGRMGTMIWTPSDSIRLRINRSDVFAVNGNHRGEKAGPADYWGGCAAVALHLGDDGTPFASSPFTQRLSLYEAEDVIDCGGIKVRCFVSSSSDLLVMEIHDRRDEPRALRIDLSMWRDPEVVNGTHVARYHFGGAATSMTLVQEFEEDDYYCGSAVALQVGSGEASYCTPSSDRCRSVELPPSPEPQLFLISSAASWDRGADIASAAVRVLEDSAGQTYDHLRAAHTPWWSEFWSRTFVTLNSDDGVADFMERVRTLQLYYMASSSRGALPAKWNGSIFLTGDDFTYWGSQFWVWTTQISYYPLHAANAIELTDPFFDMYVDQLPNAVRAGEQRTGSRGAYILESGQFDGPIVLPDDVAAEYRDVWLGPKRFMELSPRAASYGSFDGGLRALDTTRFHDREEFPSQAAGRYSWVSHIATSGCKIAKHAWWRFRYSGDRQWLSSHAYPLLRETVEFYRNMAMRDEDGVYHICGLNQFEGSWGTNDGLLDLTAIRGTAPLAIAAAEILEVDAELRGIWSEFLANLAPYPMGSDPQSHKVVDPGLWSIGHVGTVDHPRQADHVHEEFIFGVFPFEVWTLETEDEEIERNVRALAELNKLRTDLVHGQMWGLTSAGRTPVMGSRMAQGEELPAMLAAYYATFNQHGGPLPNGFSLFENAADPSIEPLGCIAMALNEALVQSVSAEPGSPEVIRLLPAWPKSWNASFRLLVRGGFLVSAIVSIGKLEFVEIESRNGEYCRIRKPWDEGCRLLDAEGATQTVKSDIIDFETRAGARYLLWPEGAATPEPQRIVGEPSVDPPSYEFTLADGVVARGILGVP